MAKSFQESLLLLFTLTVVFYISRTIATNQSNAGVFSDDCPTWQFFNFTSKRCECGSDIHKAIRCNDTTNDVQILNCYCMTLNQVGKMEAGKCFIGCDHSLSIKGNIYSRLPQTKSKVNDWLCGEMNKNGSLCGTCKKGYSPIVYTYDLSCGKCTAGRLQNVVKFVAIMFVPLTAFYLLVLLFKVSATSPPLSTYVIFSQCISEPISTRMALRSVQKFTKLNILARGVLSAYGVWNLDFFRSFSPPICLDIPTLLTLALDYTSAFYSLFLILLTYLLIKLYASNVRVLVHVCKWIECVVTTFQEEWSARTSLVNVFSTFFLLSYVKIMSVSFTLLIPTTFYNIHGDKVGTFLYYDASIPYFGKEHLPYAIVAIIVVLFFIVLPSFFITLYPYKWFQHCLNCSKIKHQAIHTFADCYLGWFKDGTERGTSDRRFVMSLYLGLRIIIFVFYTLTLSVYLYAFAAVALIMFSIIISLLKPYKDKWKIYNTLDPAMILVIAMSYGAVLCVDVASEKAFEFVYFSAAVLFITVSLPLLYITGMVLFWLVKHRSTLVQIVKLLKAMKLCQVSSEHETLDESECAPVLHRLEHPDQYDSTADMSTSESVYGEH